MIKPLALSKRELRTRLPDPHKPPSLQKQTSKNKKKKRKDSSWCRLLTLVPKREDICETPAWKNRGTKPSVLSVQTGSKSQHAGAQHAEAQGTPVPWAGVGNSRLLCLRKRKFMIEFHPLIHEYIKRVLSTDQNWE